MGTPTQDEIETAVYVIGKYIEYLETFEPYATNTIREAHNLRRSLEDDVDEVFPAWGKGGDGAA